jgi:hypothetical protein
MKEQKQDRTRIQCKDCKYWYKNNDLYLQSNRSEEQDREDGWSFGCYTWYMDGCSAGEKIEKYRDNIK